MTFFSTYLLIFFTISNWKDKINTDTGTSLITPVYIYIQSTRDITNFKEPNKKFVISKVRYIEIHYIKSINQQNLFKRYLKENLDFIRFL
jgi:hypothetical protein